MRPRYIYPVTKRKIPLSAGNKAHSLQRMLALGLPVPPTFFCDWTAQRSFLAGEKDVLDKIEVELSPIIDPAKSYAVRSSANLEDSELYSFAGQFETILNARGIPAVLKAIQSVWSSIESPQVNAYLEKHNLAAMDLHMAVVIQEMVTPVFSGVALSKNPVNGTDEIIIEAVRGQGSSLVQEGVTPERWVYKWGYWLEKSEGSSIPFAIIQKIAEQITEITTRLDYPVDTEWVYDGHGLYWVQMREITAIKLRNMYSNHLSKEFMPGMIKPLPFLIGTEIMNSTILSWLEEILGPLPIKSSELVKSFYYHSYFNMGALGTIFKSFGFPAESMEMLIGVLPPGAGKMKLKPSLKTFSLLPGAFSFFIKKVSIYNKMIAEVGELEVNIRSAEKEPLEDLTWAQIMERIGSHFRTMRVLAYDMTLSLFLLSMFNRVLRRQLGRRGVDMSNFDLTEGMTELEEYYPASSIEKLNRQYRDLSPALQETVNSAECSHLQEIEGLQDFPARFADLLDRFGHLGDSGNDFSIPPWRETPEVLLKMVTGYEPPPHNPALKVRLADLKARRQAGPAFLFFYHRARDFQYLRERSSSLYTHGKLLFRYYYLALARQLVEQCVIDAPEDIFYLTPQQVQQHFENPGSISDPRTLIARHKSDMQRYQDVRLPTVIYGDEPPPVYESHANVLPGIVVSLGCYTGRACVVKNAAEFPKLKHGDVLIIPYSDVSWTPLFARAGALVSESGGLLSHGSIVAREYNIPAVVAVEKATSIPDGILVTVDAHQGFVRLHESFA